MEKLKKQLDGLISELEDSDAIYERLENLISVIRSTNMST